MPPFSFTPSMTNTVFVPDQLIAGNHAIVTDVATIASGQVLTRGTLIGKQTAGTFAAAAAAKAGGNTGNGTFGAIAGGNGAREGVYVLTMTAATTFRVTDPSGDELVTGGTGVAYASLALSFTLTAGGTPFIAGDAFNITVTEGAALGTWIKAAAAALDGSQQPRNWALLASDIDTSPTGYNANTAGVAIYLAGEFDGTQMVFGTGLTAAIVKEAFREIQSALYIKIGALSNVIV